jgi:hypothetical protein
MGRGKLRPPTELGDITGMTIADSGPFKRIMIGMPLRLSEEISRPYDIDILISIKWDIGRLRSEQKRRMIPITKFMLANKVIIVYNFSTFRRACKRCSEKGER